MAKKQVQKVTDVRLLKNGKQQAYIGRRKATEEEYKQYVKDNYKVVDRNVLPDNVREYFDRAKGGLIRRDNAITDNKGRLLSDKFKKQVEKQLGVSLDKIKEAKNLDRISDVFKDKGIRDRFDKLLTVGIDHYYNSHKLVDKINEANVKKFIVNGKEVTKEQAIKEVSDVIFAVKRAFDNVDMDLSIKFVGVDTMIINLPTKSQIKEGDKKKLEDNFDMHIYTSPIKTSKNGKKTKIQKSDIVNQIEIIEKSELNIIYFFNSKKVTRKNLMALIEKHIQGGGVSIDVDFISPNILQVKAY